MRTMKWIQTVAFLATAVLLAGCAANKDRQVDKAAGSGSGCCHGAGHSAAPADPATPTAAVPPATQPAITQKTCPVMGGPIDQKVFTDYNGRRVYFCCPGCIGKFKQDPDKYLAKL